MTANPVATEATAWILRMAIGVFVHKGLKGHTANTGCLPVQIHPASMVESAKRQIMGIVTSVSVHRATLDSTVRGKWTNVPHYNAPMVVIV